MSLRIKQNGQRMTPKPTASTPKDGAGTAAATHLRAVCGCGGRVIDQKPVFVTPVPVTHRKPRRIAASMTV